MTNRITWVHVEWSESAEFKDATNYRFEEFERRALKSAKNCNLGYFKTMIEVYWENTVEPYKCRLDLCQREDHGFAHHIKELQLFRYSEGNDREKAEAVALDAYLETHLLEGVDPEKPMKNFGNWS